MGVRFVAQLVGSLSSPVAATSDAPTWLTTNPEWVEYFGLALSAHHGMTAEPLGSIGFEVTFRNACAAVDWQVSNPGSATLRFVDLDVTPDDGTFRKLSLKSTAAQRLSETSVHITKLTEAAWIQDVRSARARKAATVQLFQEYRAAVDALVILRAFRRSTTDVPSRYQLVEIPSDIFASIDAAPTGAFAADGPTIDCAYGGDPQAARVMLDRSDGKIVVKQIKLSACTVHAEWHMARVPDVEG